MKWPHILNNNIFLYFMQVHEGIKKFKCKLCPQAYGQSHELKKHLINFHKKIIPKNTNINNLLNDMGGLSNDENRINNL